MVLKLKNKQLGFVDWIGTSYPTAGRRLPDAESGRVICEHCKYSELWTLSRENSYKLLQVHLNHLENTAQPYENTFESAHHVVLAEGIKDWWDAE